MRGVSASLPRAKTILMALGTPVYGKACINRTQKHSGCSPLTSMDHFVYRLCTGSTHTSSRHTIHEIEREYIDTSVWIHTQHDTRSEHARRGSRVHFTCPTGPPQKGASTSTTLRHTFCGTTSNRAARPPSSLRGRKLWHAIILPQDSGTVQRSPGVHVQRVHIGARGH